MYDLIGDIHGHADELRALLTKLGYRQTKGSYKHPERKVIFLGDFIDRGPKIKQVLETVRPMIDEGAALSVMGNHEFNAIAYHTEHPDYTGSYLREHSESKTKQHKETLTQLGDSLSEFVEWFKTLPLWLDLPGLRVVHACWDPSFVDHLAKYNQEPLSKEFMLAASDKKSGNLEYHAVEALLKGKEIALPEGISFRDKDKHERENIRVRWFEDIRGKSYAQASLPAKPEIPDTLIPDELIINQVPYPLDEKPLFLGHYWLEDSIPNLLAPNVCCLDYSVAKQGYLCSYRWNGEKVLDERNFVVV
jgi:hypothetical protein